VYLDDHRTALYRFYDAAGALLYVGITHDIEERWGNHRTTKEWWPDVAHQTVEWYDTRPAALAAEVVAIRTEEPRYNVASSPLAPGPRELAANEITEGQTKELLRGLELGAAIVEPVFIVNRRKTRDRAAVVVPFGFYQQALEVRAAIEALGLS
jgi:hypothetical protein